MITMLICWNQNITTINDKSKSILEKEMNET